MPTITDRAWQTPRDFADVGAFLQDMRLSLDFLHFLHVGEFYWQLINATAVYDLASILHLWHDAWGNVVAFALINPLDNCFFQQIHPQFNEDGLPEAVWAWLKTQMDKLRYAPITYHTLINPYDMLQAQFLAQQGLTQGADYVLLRGGLADLPPVSAEIRAHVPAWDYMPAALPKLPIAPTDEPPVLFYSLSEDVMRGFAIGWLDKVNADGLFAPLPTTDTAIIHAGLYAMQAQGMATVTAVLPSDDERIPIYEAGGLSLHALLPSYAYAGGKVLA